MRSWYKPSSTTNWATSQVVGPPGSAATGSGVGVGVGGGGGGAATAGVGKLEGSTTRVTLPWSSGCSVQKNS